MVKYPIIGIIPITIIQLDLIFYFQKALSLSLSTKVVNFIMETFCLAELWLHDHSKDTADNRKLSHIALLFSIKNRENL
jgi:hypothetical protein